MNGTPEALAKAEYLGAVVQETLRLEPILPDVIRTLVGRETLGGHRFEAGTHVASLAALVHQREDLYPDPSAFRPERFLERKVAPHEFLAFGGGVRRCIGAALATYEMKIVLGTLLREVEVDSLSEERPVRRSVSMATSGPVRLRVRRRSAAQRRQQPVEEHAQGLEGGLDGRGRQAQEQGDVHEVQAERGDREHAGVHLGA